MEETRKEGTRYLCHIYDTEEAWKASEEFETEPYKGYGEVTRLPDGRIAHDNYSWDSGGRGLVRCAKCGALLLVQSIHFEAADPDDDGYYRDWLPVKSEEEADLLNLLLEPGEFEDHPVKHLRMNNFRYCWTKGKDPEPADIEELKDAVVKQYGKRALGV